MRPFGFTQNNYMTYDLSLCLAPNQSMSHLQQWGASRAISQIPLRRVGRQNCHRLDLHPHAGWDWSSQLQTLGIRSSSDGVSWWRWGARGQQIRSVPGVSASESLRSYKKNQQHTNPTKSNYLYKWRRNTTTKLHHQIKSHPHVTRNKEIKRWTAGGGVAVHNGLPKLQLHPKYTVNL